MANEQNASAREKIAMLRGARQVRNFSPRPVPPEVVNDILEVARWTGSGMNAQPWAFVVVRNQETLRAIAEAESQNSHIARATFAILVLMDAKSAEVATYDEGRLTERLLLAAAAHGVGAGVWWFRDGGAAARRILGIPDHWRVRTAVSFGYPPEEGGTGPSRNAGRKPLAELVHEERY